MQFFTEHNDLVPDKYIGAGAFGSVVIGCRPRDVPSDSDRRCDVAIKTSIYRIRVRGERSEEDIEGDESLTAARNELLIHELLAKRAPSAVPKLIASYNCIEPITASTQVVTGRQIIAADRLHITLAKYLKESKYILTPTLFDDLKRVVKLVSERAGVLHGDLHAENIMLDYATPPRWKLIDFGLAFRWREFTTAEEFMDHPSAYRMGWYCKENPTRLAHFWEMLADEETKAFRIPRWKHGRGTVSEIVFRNRKWLNLFEVYSVLVDKEKAFLRVDEDEIRPLTFEEDFPELPAELVELCESYCKFMLAREKRIERQEKQEKKEQKG